MEKIKGKIIITFILATLILTNIVSAVTIHNNVNANEVEVGDQLEFTIDFNESIQTSDFSVYYDSKKLTYIGASTESVKTNYVEENNELICCYYDFNKIGTDKITLKFKATEETNKTNIEVKNITVHTNTEEQQINNIVSENVKIENKKALPENTSNQENENTTPENNLQNNTTDNSQINNTKIIKPILKTGSDLRISISRHLRCLRFCMT